MDTKAIYILIHDSDKLKLLINSTDFSTGRKYTLLKYPDIIKYISEYDKMPLARDDEQSLYEFYLSYLIISKGEPDQLNFIRRIKPHRSRNIQFQVKPVKNYLREAMTDSSEKKTSKQLDRLINKAFMDIRRESGFPEHDPVEYSYIITDAVIAEAVNPSCKEYLKQLRTREYIFPQDLPAICKELKSKYASEAEKIIEALQKTQTREHIAAFSISTESNQIYISLANVNRQHVRMEAWKFMALIERAGEAIKLHEFQKSRYGAVSGLFAFNNQSSGVVAGKLMPHQATIQIVCLQSENGDPQDRATFFIDLTYMLSIYITIKRLEEDKVRFTRLKEQAETLMSTKDPFELLYQPLTSGGN